MHVIGLLVLTLLQLHSVAAQESYKILFQRVGDDIIVLRCRHVESDQFLQINETIRYWINRTGDARQDGFVSDLQMNLGITRLILANDPPTMPTATFMISPGLEGRYTCGRRIDDNNAVESVPGVRLTSQHRSGLRFQKEFAALSGEAVELECSYEVGMLSGCYFGRWLKNSVVIIEISSPGQGCANVMDTPTNPKYTIDRRNFTLTIMDIAPADGGNYTCELMLVDPQVPAGQTVPFNPPVTHTLSVDVPSLVIDGPEDEIVGMNSTTGNLSTSATFACTAVGLPAGLPAPVITWIYNTSLTGEIQTYTDNDPNVMTINMGKDRNGEYNGRFRVKSTLVLPISPTDGGTIRCKTGPGDGQFNDARLTVLSPPLSIGLIKSCGGEIVYEINLPVRLNRPAVMKFEYMNGRNEIMPRRGAPAEVEVGDTNIIFFREDRDTLPFSSYRVIVTLSIATGSQIRDGPSFTSVQTINVNEITPGAVIGMSAGLSVFVVGVVLFILFVVVICFLVQKNLLKVQFKHIQESANKLNVSEVDNGTNEQRNLRELIDKINKFGKDLGLASDAESDDKFTEEDLQDFKQSMERALKTIELREAKQGAVASL